MTAPDFPSAQRQKALRWTLFGSTFLLGSLVFLILPGMASPVALRHFDRAPQLVDTQTTSPQTNVGSRTYQLVITVPVDAGAPLQALKISQPQNLAVINFEPQQTRIVVGQTQTEIPLVSLGGMQPQNGDLILEFQRSVQPGETITIALTPKRNPTIAGIYLLGVTAYAEGDDGTGIFLGYSQLDFHDN